MSNRITTELARSAAPGDISITEEEVERVVVKRIVEARATRSGMVWLGVYVELPSSRQLGGGVALTPEQALALADTLRGAAAEAASAPQG